MAGGGRQTYAVELLERRAENDGPNKAGREERQKSAFVILSEAKDLLDSSRSFVASGLTADSNKKIGRAPRARFPGKSLFSAPSLRTAVRALSAHSNIYP